MPGIRLDDMGRKTVCNELDMLGSVSMACEFQSPVGLTVMLRLARTELISRSRKV